MVKSLKQKSSDMSKDGAPPNEREKTGRLMHHPRQDLYLIPLGTIGTAPGAVPTLDQPRINIRTKAHPNIIICCCRGREGALFRDILQNTILYERQFVGWRYVSARPSLSPHDNRALANQPR
jgi:hypothetical protein